jgi:uncharacterized protein (TIGR03435 family)
MPIVITLSHNTRRSLAAQTDEPGVQVNFREVMIPMRDGARLQTVVLSPKNPKAPLPFLIERTPYGAYVRRTQLKNRLVSFANLFEIEARAPANATKDQMRLMMQALLAERFQLAVHFETPEVPVLAMILVKPGKPGPGLRPHSEGPSCDAPASQHIFPATCYLAGWQFADGVGRETLGSQRKGSGRDLTMADIAGYLASWGSLDRPMIDRTGLTGEYDFTVLWKPDPNIGGAE